MDFALESGTAAHASHRIVLKRHIAWGRLPTSMFHVQERRKFLWVIPYWATLEEQYSLASAEDWLTANWKTPRYYHVTRKTTA